MLLVLVVEPRDTSEVNVLSQIRIGDLLSFGQTDNREMSEAEIRISTEIKDLHHSVETINATTKPREIRNDDSMEIEGIKDRIVDPTRETLLHNSVLIRL